MWLGDRAFGKWVGLDECRGWAPRHEISAHIKRRRTLSAVCYMRTQWEDDHLPTRQRDLTRHQICLYLDFRLPSFQNWEINVCHLSHSIYGIFLQQPEWTKTSFDIPSTYWFAYLLSVCPQQNQEDWDFVFFKKYLLILLDWVLFTVLRI